MALHPQEVWRHFNLCILAKSTSHAAHIKEKKGDSLQLLAVALLGRVEMEGLEPSSKRGTHELSTCLVLT